MPETITSRPYSTAACCERCVFGRGSHAEFCAIGYLETKMDAAWKELGEAALLANQVPAQGVATEYYPYDLTGIPNDGLPTTHVHNVPGVPNYGGISRK